MYYMQPLTLITLCLYSRKADTIASGKYKSMQNAYCAESWYFPDNFQLMGIRFTDEFVPK